LTIQNKTLTLTDLEMEEEAGIKEVINVHEEKIIKEEIFTKVVRAGKRTYFFDVKATRKDDYYLTITESKKRLGKEGKVFYEKHKIFLYKEDFEKFTEGLKDAVTYIDNGKDDLTAPIPSSDAEPRDEKSAITTEEFTNVEFDDLGKK
jgi:monomeric isocitrate dehydrogenase